EDDREHDWSLDEDFQEQLSLFTRQFKKQWIQKKSNQRHEGTSKGLPSKDAKYREAKYTESSNYMKKKGPQCFECGGYGHIQSECANNLKKKRQAFKATWSDDETEDQSDYEESNCAFIANVDLGDEESLEEQLKDLQEKWSELLMVNKRNVTDKNRLMSEVDALKERIDGLTRKIEELEGEKTNLLFEINQLKSYQKWIKVAGAEVLDHHSIMAKSPGDMTCIGYTDKGKMPQSLEVKFVKASEVTTSASPHQSKKKHQTLSYKNPYHHYRCYNCNKWGHIQRQCGTRWSKRWATKRYKQIWIPKQSASVANTCYRVTRDQWLLDSGCSHHMTGDRENLINIKTLEQGSVRFGGGAQGKIVGSGTLNVSGLPPIKNV
ncbi:unnamed protein product, partial [Cuscuta campestris]